MQFYLSYFKHTLYFTRFKNKKKTLLSCTKDKLKLKEQKLNIYNYAYNVNCDKKRQIQGTSPLMMTDV